MTGTVKLALCSFVSLTSKCSPETLYRMLDFHSVLRLPA